MAAAALGIVYFAGRAAKNPEVAATGATAFEAYLWTSIVTTVVKGALGRHRPSGEDGAHGFFEGDTIFPSGHTSRSFAIAAVLADRHGRKAAYIAYPVAALIGLSTLQQDTHWASDVLAGAGLGLAIGKGIAALHPAPGRASLAGVRAAWQVVPHRGGAALQIAY